MKDIGAILRKPCDEKKVEILEAEACPEHIHMLVSILRYISVAQFAGYLKRKSALMIFDRHANLKYKYGNRNLSRRGSYADTVGKNEKAIREYIKSQVEEDYIKDRMTVEYSFHCLPETMETALKAALFCGSSIWWTNQFFF